MADPNSDFYAAIRCLQGDFAQRKACRNACTVDTCPLILSFWNYRPNVPLNAAFAAMFGIYSIAVLLLGIYSRKFRSYTAVLFIGEVMEVFGFIARVYAHAYPFSDIAYIMQMVCLTLAPAFMAAGIYFSLQRIVLTYSGELSRIPPLWIPRVFIACDVVSLVLQGAGGAIAALLATDEKQPDKGNYTIIGGLSFQALTLLIFLFLAGDYAFRLWKVKRRLGYGVLNPDPIAASLRQSKRLKFLIVSLSVAGLLIFFRSIYRVLELSEGWKGYLMSQERFVVGLETIPVIIAGLLLAVIHPGFSFQGEDEPIKLRFWPEKKQPIMIPFDNPSREPLYTIRRWNEKLGKAEIEIIYDEAHPVVQKMRNR